MKKAKEKPKQQPRIVAASAASKGLKIAHFSLQNGSGMHAVAQTMVESEKALGLDSVLVNIELESEWEHVLDADIHVSHTHIPVIYKGKSYRKQVTKPFKMVAVFHGTPEHVFEGSVRAGENGAYAAPNCLMITQRDLRIADARVTFWDRHKAIYDTMVDKGTKVHCVPLGVDTKWWSEGVSRGKYQGKPSLWAGENCHTIKWPFDLLTMWPWVAEEVDEAMLHCCYVPSDQHRYWFPWIHANGAYYRAHVGSWTYPHIELRNVFKSVDVFIGMVMKGDANRLSMEANAAGVPTISYVGNEYSDYWLTEGGDQRVQAKELVAILKGDVEKRKKTPVPDSSEMAAGMIKIYHDVL